MKSMIREIITTYLICFLVGIIYCAVADKWSWFSWRMELYFFLIVTLIVICEQLIKKFFRKK
jgi:membrane protein implicated in regulation of membrane protease activity